MAEPASSPVEVFKLASFVITTLPEASLATLFTWLAPAIDGYGIGMGPPGVGVLQTSGKTGTATPGCADDLKVTAIFGEETDVPIEPPPGYRSLSSDQYIRIGARLRRRSDRSARRRGPISPRSKPCGSTPSAACRQGERDRRSRRSG